MAKLITEDFHLVAFCATKGMHFRTRLPGNRPVFEIEAEAAVLDSVVREFEANSFLAKYNAALRTVRRRASDAKKYHTGGPPLSHRGGPPRKPRT